MGVTLTMLLFREVFLNAGACNTKAITVGVLTHASLFENSSLMWIGCLPHIIHWRGCPPTCFSFGEEFLDLVWTFARRFACSFTVLVKAFGQAASSMHGCNVEHVGALALVQW